MRLLLIEDNERLAEHTATVLRRAGFAIDAVGSGEDGLAALAGVRYDVIVLDLGLPDIDGLQVLRNIRQKSDATPVLILTARGGIDDRVEGLNLGADDYLAKPFAFEELLARIKALLRRPTGALGIELVAGNVKLDTVGRTVEVAGTSVHLSRREIDLLEELMRRAGRVVPKDALEERLYGFDEEVASNTIEVNLHRLRKRLASAGAAVVIHTLRGVGYMLAEAA